MESLAPSAPGETDPAALDPAERILDLEAELRQREARLKEVTGERDEAYELTGRMREHLEAAEEMIERWIEAFDMQQDDRGIWVFNSDRTFEELTALYDEHLKLIREWNKLVPKYNAVVAPRERGRPLAASEAQQQAVLKQHKAKASLRAIAKTTKLSLRTVRTIVDNAAAKGRSKRANEVRRKELNQLRAASYRVRQKTRDRLPQDIAEWQKTSGDLVKAAKGLGRAR